MSIHKPSKNTNYLRQPKKPFEMIYREVLDKLRNSDALAVYCHLAGKPDDWEINDQYLMNHFAWGRDKVRNAINSLIVNKLVKRIQLIDEKGKFAGRITELLDGYEFKQYIEYDKKIHKNLCEYIKQNKLSTENNPLPEKPYDGLSVDGQTAPTIEDIKAFKEEDKKQERAIRKKRESLSDDFKPNEEAREIALQRGIDINKTLFKFRHHVKSEGWKRENWHSAFIKWLLDEKIDQKKPIQEPYAAVNRMQEYVSPRNMRN